MRKYRITYRGKSRTIMASDHTVARQLGTRWLMAQMEHPENGFSSLRVAVIDVDASGYGDGKTWMLQYEDCYHCTLAEQCPRSGTCRIRDLQSRGIRSEDEGLCDVDAQKAFAIAKHLCVCAAGAAGNPCTCKSVERAERVNPKGWVEIDGVKLPSVATWADRRLSASERRSRHDPVMDRRDDRLGSINHMPERE